MSNTVDYGSITESATGEVLHVDGGFITSTIATEATSIFRNIRIALENRLTTLTELSNIAFENVEIDLSTLDKGANGIEFVQAFLLPQATESLEISPTGRDLHEGIFQINYYNGVGIGGYSTKLDYIAQAFKRGTELNFSGTTVRVRNVSLGVGRREDAFFVRNIDVSYYAVTPARS